MKETGPRRTLQPVEEEHPFSSVLAEVSERLERAGIDFVVFAGVAAVTYGRPMGTDDIDVLVRRPDAERTLQVLAEAGFSVERTDERWLYKAFKHGVMVDVIFQVKGDVYLDDEMVEHSVIEEVNGRRVRLVSPEDALVIEAVSFDAAHLDHWYNALAILARTDLDWAYLRRRARLSPRRLLSLLIFAQANDLMVPNSEIEDLFQHTYG
jgi:predicted nucleotidyltransferase